MNGFVQFKSRADLACFLDDQRVVPLLGTRDIEAASLVAIATYRGLTADEVQTVTRAALACGGWVIPAQEYVPAL